jgi:hypothetical protein
MGNPAHLSSIPGTSTMVSVGSASGSIPSTKGKEVSHGAPGTVPPAPDRPFEMPEWAARLFNHEEVMNEDGNQKDWTKNFSLRVENALAGSFDDNDARTLARKEMHAAMGVYCASRGDAACFPALFVATRKYRCLLDWKKFRLSDSTKKYVPGPGEAERLHKSVQGAIVDYRGNSNERDRYAPKNFERYYKALIEYEEKIQPVTTMPPEENPLRLITLPTLPQANDDGANAVAVVDVETVPAPELAYAAEWPRLLQPAPPPDYTAPPTRILTTLLKNIEKPTVIARLASRSTEPAKLEIKRLREYLAGLSSTDRSERDHAFHGLAKAFMRVDGFDRLRVLTLVEGFFDPEHVDVNTNPKAARVIPLGLHSHQIFSEFARAEILAEFLRHYANQSLPVAETLVRVALNNYEDRAKVNSSLSSAILLGALLRTLGKRQQNDDTRPWINDGLAVRIIGHALQDIPPLYQGHANDMFMARPEVLQCFDALKEGLDAAGRIDLHLSNMIDEIYRAGYLGTESRR